MPFTSLAVACLKAIHPARLWCKTPSPNLLMAGLLGVGAALGLVGKADAGVLDNWGYLNIENDLNSQARSVSVIRDIEYIPGVTDGYDSNIDHTAFDQPNLYPNCYSDIPGYHLWDDIRVNDSTALYDIKLGFEGVLSSPTSNWLKFRLSNGGTFGNLPIYLQKKDSQGNLTGPIYDVKDIINNHSGTLNLDNVPDKTYSQWTPYASYALDIGGNTIPEPATLALLGLGAASLIAGGRKRKRAE